MRGEEKKISFQKARWIGISREEMKRCQMLPGDLNNRFAYYVLDVELHGKNRLILNISATARYRLWMNGESVLSGPCKGDRYRQYFDEIDVSSYLREGRNRFAVQVLACDSYIVNNLMPGRETHQPLIAYAGLPLGHRLAVEGIIYGEHGEETELTTGIAPWRAALEETYVLTCQQPYLTWMGSICEEIPKNAWPFDWKNPEKNLGEMSEPEILEQVNFTREMNRMGMTGVLIMQEREIPYMYEQKNCFQNCIWQKQQQSCRDFWIEPNTNLELIFDAGEIKTAFVKYPFIGGEGAKIRFTYAERFTAEEEIARDDYAHGSIEGMYDEIILDGSNIVYEPFWYRTFRYIKIQIHTSEEKAKICIPYFMETGYPLEVKGTLKSSQGWVEDVWGICVNTVKRCMNETYMDCPYYEQMQFPMDTRLQALYTYLLSGDTRLAKKALRDFHYSMIPDGLIQGKYPGSHTQIISTFSLHYIFMLKEYYDWTEDEAVVLRYRPDIDLILDYYDRKINEQGLVENLGYWEFVDWRSQWDESDGAPLAAKNGPSAIINLMYAYALSCSAYLYENTGRTGVAEEYRMRQKKICQAVNQYCWSEDRQMYREGPDFEQYSIHAQAWAVLNGMKEGDSAGKLMEISRKEPDVIQNSFSTSFEIFKALKKANRYNLAEDIFSLWKGLSEKGCTACPEVPVNSRSECHAWSAQPIYEFIHHILGVEVLEKGWKRIRICPDLNFISDLRGEIMTPRGIMKFDLKKEKSGYSGEIWIPEGIKGSFQNGIDNSERMLQNGENIIGGAEK